MIKKLATTFMISILLLFACPSVKAATFTDNQIVEANKNWTIHFNKDIVLDDLSKQGIAVTDSNGNNADVTLSFGQDNKTIIVNAPQNGYKEGEKYKLTIGNAVHSSNNKKINEPIVVSFYIKDNEVEYGNTNANISNHGRTCEKNNYIYYSGADGIGLYKINTDGSGKVKLLDEPVECINVVNDWIYYLNIDYKRNPKSQIYKIKTDGTCKTQVYSENNISNLIVVNDYIFFKALNSNSEDLRYGIYKIKIDGTNKTMIDSSDYLVNINIVGDYIYYNTGNAIYKIKTDASEKKELYSGSTRFMTTDNKNIYFELNDNDYSINNIYSSDLDGNEVQKVCTFTSNATELFQPYFFNVEDNWIFYSTMDSSGGALYKVKTDGTNLTKLDDDFCNNICLVRNSLYCNKTEYASGDYNCEAFEMMLYTISKDGKEKQIVDSCIVLDD